MNILICCLTYGNRPTDILYRNIVNAGHPATFININREGIANALNDGIDAMKEWGFDAVGFLANDIIEPVDWLFHKSTNLDELHSAGIVATTVQQPQPIASNQHIIGNWLMSSECIDKVGYFCESMFPYGPVDLDYCDRVHAAGLCTYYVPNIKAEHAAEHATGSEYGYDKGAMVAKYWPGYVSSIAGYRDGSINIKKERL